MMKMYKPAKIKDHYQTQLKGCDSIFGLTEGSLHAALQSFT